jgi:predicted dehydrogenase
VPSFSSLRRRRRESDRFLTCSRAKFSHDPSTNDALMLEIEAFVAAIRGERPVAVWGEDGRRALAAALAITAALRRPG